MYGVMGLLQLDDVHYAAANYYDPAKAQFTDFNPFLEFVAGPLHAGTFGPNKLDNTFGPQVRFISIPEGLKPNRPPTEGLHNLKGERIYAIELPPEV